MMRRAFGCVVFAASILGLFQTLGAQELALRAEYTGPYTELNQYRSFGDVNGDGIVESYSPTWNVELGIYGTLVREWNHDFTFRNVDTLEAYGACWDVGGDVNGNGLKELLVQNGDIFGNGFLTLYEQETPTSWPTRRIATLVFPGKQVIYYARFFDIEGDGISEVVMSPNSLPCGQSGVSVFRWDADRNTLEPSWSVELFDEVNTKAVGDFNGNGLIEIAIDFPNRCGGLLENQKLIEHREIMPRSGVYETTGPLNNARHEKPAFDPTVVDSVSYVLVFEYEPDTDSFVEVFRAEHELETQFGPTFTLDYNGDGHDDFGIGYSTWPIGYKYLVCTYDGGYELQEFVDDTLAESQGHVWAVSGDFGHEGRDCVVASVPYTARSYRFDGAAWNYQLLQDSVTMIGGWKQDFNNNGYPDAFIVFFHYDSTMLVGIYESSNAPTSVSSNSEFPTIATLYQNYPNPFNPTTLIRYVLPKAGYARLEVFNLLGERVATLMSGEALPGSYEMNFKADGLPSGTYFCRLSLDGNPINTRKMLFVK